MNECYVLDYKRSKELLNAILAIYRNDDYGRFSNSSEFLSRIRDIDSAFHYGCLPCQSDNESLTDKERIEIVIANKKRTIRFAETFCRVYKNTLDDAEALAYSIKKQYDWGTSLIGVICPYVLQKMGVSSEDLVFTIELGLIISRIVWDNLAVNYEKRYKTDYKGQNEINNTIKELDKYLSKVNVEWGESIDNRDINRRDHDNLCAIKDVIHSMNNLIK